MSTAYICKQCGHVVLTVNNSRGKDNICCPECHSGYVWLEYSAKDKNKWLLDALIIDRNAKAGRATEVLPKIGYYSSKGLEANTTTQLHATISSHEFDVIIYDLLCKEYAKLYDDIDRDITKLKAISYMMIDYKVRLEQYNSSLTKED